MAELIFLQVLNMSLTASFVIAAVLLARLFLKGAPKLFSYALWSVVLFRLLCPFSFKSEWSLVPFNADAIPEDVLYSQIPAIQTGVSSIDNAVNPLLPMPAVGASVNPLQVWASLGTFLWLAGIAVLFLYSLLSLLRLRRKLVGAVRLRDRIYLADHIPTPFVLGVLRPKIYLPSTLSENETPYILLHEQTHIRRLDPVVKIIAFFALVLHWFNPLVWIAFFLAAKDMEMACDESVMKRMDADIRQAYSASLLHLAAGRHMAAGTPLAFGEGNIRGRIKNVMRYKKPALWVILAAVAVVVLAVVLLSANRADRPEASRSGYVIETLGYTLQLPEDYRGETTLLPDDELTADTIAAVYHTASFTANPGGGFLFRIVRHTPAQFEDYWPEIDLIGGAKHFARDDAYYYSIERPTDVQADLAVFEEYQALAEQIDNIAAWFTANNHLTEYDHNAAVYEPEYTYPGVHAVYSCTLSNQAKFQVILSKPVRQGEDGIWCVERMYDEYGNLYIAMPDTELTAKEYYAQMQQEADDGHRAGLLDAEDVALTYLENVWDFARHISASQIEYSLE